MSNKINQSFMFVVFLIIGVALSYASPIVITVSGDHDASVLGAEWPFAAQHFSLSFSTEQTPSNASAQSGGGAFSVAVDITFISGGSIQTNAGTAGWFQYPGGFSGLDVRFGASDGSFLQTITSLPAPVYAGTDSNPTIILMDLSNVWVSLHHYPPGSQFAVLAGAANGVYLADASTSPIPEPATLLLFVSGVIILGLAGYSRRKVLERDES